AKDREPGGLAQFLFQPIPESGKPSELVVVFLRSDRLPVGNVSAYHADRAGTVADARGDDPLLVIGKGRHAGSDLAQSTLRQDRHAVVGLLPGPRAAITCCLDLQDRKPVVLELGLLQANDV